ncbi:hypothetical protein CPB84DRAFT_1687570 [Gymnopilus junonius]|uniref:NAD(P)-binding protein n=1 Tax=Gymnopilus junonius TaxID=109634 RepID=A0A9P5TIV4_GYMJU|nr:hypothetical protein CPB84DRAFT_1687570 [Gymnopilus junonius]
MFSRTFDPTKDLNDLTGKVIIVTGANTGIGYFTVRHLVNRGAKVYLGSRSEERGKTAIEKLKQEGIGSGEVVLFLCDIGSPSSAKKAAEDFMKWRPGWTSLVCFGRSYIVIWPLISVFHIGTFQLTTCLLPLLIKTSEEPNSDVRIVTVSSNVHANTKPVMNFKNLDEFKADYAKDMLPSLSRYSVSKLATILFSNALQRKLAPTSIICITLHPGIVNTSLASHLSYPRIAGFLTWVFFKAPDEGAYNTCFAAASPIVRESADEFKGAYLVPVGKKVDTSPIAQKVDVQDDLWKTTEDYIHSLSL